MTELLHTVANAGKVIHQIHLAGSATAVSIAEGAEIDSQTVRRTLAVLTSRGYVRRLESNAYVLGPMWHPLARVASENLMQLVQHHIEDLAQSTRETVTLIRVVLSTPPKLRVEAVANGSRDLVRVEYQVGYSMPMLPTAAGKIAAAFGTPTPATIHIDSAELERIRTTGRASSHNALLTDMHGIAQAVIGHEGQLLGIISVIAPTQRSLPEDIVGDLLAQTVAELTATLVGLGWGD